MPPESHPKTVAQLINPSVITNINAHEQGVLPSQGQVRFSWLLVVLLFTALAMRLLYIYQSSLSPLFPLLLGDERAYSNFAKAISSGDWAPKNINAVNPLEPYILGAIQLLFGTNPFVPRVIQALADVGTCYFIFRITHRLFGQRAAFLALGLSALYGPMIFMSTRLLGEVWSLFFISLSLTLLLHAQDRKMWRFLGGICFGLAAIGRPNLLILAPFIPISAALAGPTLKPKARFRRFLLWFGGMTMVFGPIRIANVASGVRDPLPPQAGIHFWLGNNANANGYYHLPAQHGLTQGSWGLMVESTALASKATGHELKPHEAGRYWMKRTRVEIFDDPLHFIRGILKKTLLFLSGYEKPIEVDYNFAIVEAKWLDWLAIEFPFILGLGLAGMVLAFPRRRSLGLLYFYVLGYTGTILLFYVAMRLRLPVMIGLIPFAGHALEHLTSSFQARAWRPFAWSLTIASVVGTGSFLGRDLNQARRDAATTTVELGLASERQGLGSVALSWFKVAARTAPEDPRVWGAMAISYARSGLHADAIKAWERLNQLTPPDAQILRMMGAANNELNQQKKAIVAYRAAIALSPENPQLYWELARSLLIDGDLDAHLATLEKGLTLATDTAQVNGFEGAIRKASRMMAGRKHIEAVDSPDALTPKSAPEHLETTGIPPD